MPRGQVGARGQIFGRDELPPGMDSHVHNGGNCEQCLAIQEGHGVKRNGSVTDGAVLDYRQGGLVNQPVPVEPNPFPPRVVSLKADASVNFACKTGVMTNWATRRPRSTEKASRP